MMINILGWSSLCLACVGIIMLILTLFDYDYEKTFFKMFESAGVLIVLTLLLSYVITAVSEVVAEKEFQRQQQINEQEIERKKRLKVFYEQPKAKPSCNNQFCNIDNINQNWGNRLFINPTTGKVEYFLYPMKDVIKE